MVDHGMILIEKRFTRPGFPQAGESLEATN